MNTTPFVRAVMAEGHTEQFARELLRGMPGMADGRTSFPLSSVIALCTGGYSVKADLQNGKLVLLSLTQLRR